MFFKKKKLIELKQIEDLTAGCNYQVWLNLYGSIDSDISLQAAVLKNISKKCRIENIRITTAELAKNHIIQSIFYQGDVHCGPKDLESKRSKITYYLDSIFDLISIENSEIISEFYFKEGHPAYPVYWDFAYDIHSNGQRWIFVGSSSD